ncbi:MAG: hypothetical protein WKF35_09305 [Ferruginibacter sp.]
MKFLLLFISIVCFQNGSAQLITNVSWTEKSSLPAAEIIYYNPEKNLEWKDFKGTPFESRAAAVTVSGFGYMADIKTRNGKGQLTISVYCYFNKEKSWVKPGKNTAYILTHEQHHFNISFIAARLFADKLKSTIFTTANYNTLLPLIYKEFGEVMNKMQNEYDGQTKNGQLKDIQEKWNDILDQKIEMITK